MNSVEERKRRKGGCKANCCFELETKRIVILGGGVDLQIFLFLKVIFILKYCSLVPFMMSIYSEKCVFRQFHH